MLRQSAQPADRGPGRLPGPPTNSHGCKNPRQGAGQGRRALNAGSCGSHCRKQASKPEKGRRAAAGGIMASSKGQACFAITTASPISVRSIVPPPSQRRHLPPRPISRLRPRRLTLALAGWRKGGRRLGAALCAPPVASRPGGGARERRWGCALCGVLAGFHLWERPPGGVSPLHLGHPHRHRWGAPPQRHICASAGRAGAEDAARARAAAGEAKGRVSPAPLPQLWPAGGESGANGGGACSRGGAGGGGGEGERPLPLVLIVDLRLRIYGRTLGFPRQAGRSGAPAPSQRGRRQRASLPLPPAGKSRDRLPSQGR